MKRQNKFEFQEEVKSLLNRSLLSEEYFEEASDLYDFYTPTGIRMFNIPPSSYIEIKYFSEDNLVAFKSIVFPKKGSVASLKDISFGNVFFVCNLTSANIERLIKRLPIGDELNIISIDDLNNAEFELSHFDALDKSADFGFFPFLKKSLPFEQLDDFLLSLIRVQIVMEAFSRGTVNMSRLIAQKNDLLPFAFIDADDKYHIFIAEGSRYTKRSPLFDENAIVHKVGYYQKDDNVTLLSIDNRGERAIEKITEKWFGMHIGFFNSFSRFDVIPKSIQYKYRKFGQSSFDSFDERSVDKYTKKVIEGNEIYFSTKNQLNDPFDLDVDVSGIKTPKALTDYRCFCTTGDNDNILMWSHYGDSHSGYCTGYKATPVLEAIENSKDIDFCVYGHVDYRKDRKPLFKHLSLLSSFFDDGAKTLVFQINQLFRKYNNWAYEKEYRYIVATTNQLNQKSSDGLSLIVKPEEYYFGNKFDFNSKTKSYLKKYIGSSCFAFELSKNEYELLKKFVDLTK